MVVATDVLSEKRGRSGRRGSRLTSTTTIRAHGVRCLHPAVQFTRVRGRREDGSAVQILDHGALEPSRPMRSTPAGRCNSFRADPSVLIASQCGWCFACDGCDGRLVLHRDLVCRRCASDRPVRRGTTSAAGIGTHQDWAPPKSSHASVGVCTSRARTSPQPGQRTTMPGARL
jgi:hypothetical protein